MTLFDRQAIPEPEAEKPRETVIALTSAGSSGQSSVLKSALLTADQRGTSPGRRAAPRSTHHKTMSGVPATIEPTSEQTYETRVQALEDELGIPTSDAQAMVDADDLTAQRN